MAEISRQSRLRFRENRLFWIPAHFYEALHHAAFSPSLHQLFALSVLTNYRLTDWVRVFGFSFDAGTEFQIAWPRRRTIELDARIYHPGTETPWFEEAPRIVLGNELSPLNRWLSRRKVIPLAELGPLQSNFRYFKIGSEDAYAYPDLVPGSVVRVNPRPDPEALILKPASGQILAVEHGLGVTCSHVRASGAGKIIFCPKQLPYLSAEMSLGTEARILGVVDLEIRRLAFGSLPAVSQQSDPAFPLPNVSRSGEKRRLSEYLHDARVRLGLSFHAASELSREIANALGHPRYFCAASTLSDTEASGRFPRHIHKLISLSALYSVPVAELAARAGLSLEAAGQEAMAVGIKAERPGRGSPSPFVKAVEGRLQEMPFFLYSAMAPLTGLSQVSVRDIFWAGATAGLAHPYLRDATFLAVNRKSKQPAPQLNSPLWAQPLYIVELRDGRLLCAACSLHGATLFLRPCTATGGSAMRLRNHEEAEVLGKVVALVRTVGRP